MSSDPYQVLLSSKDGTRLHPEHYINCEDKRWFFDKNYVKECFNENSYPMDKHLCGKNMAIWFAINEYIKQFQKNNELLKPDTTLVITKRDENSKYWRATIKTSETPNKLIYINKWGGRKTIYFSFCPCSLKPMPISERYPHYVSDESLEKYKIKDKFGKDITIGYEKHTIVTKNKDGDKIYCEFCYINKVKCDFTEHRFITGYIVFTPNY